MALYVRGVVVLDQKRDAIFPPGYSEESREEFRVMERGIPTVFGAPPLSLKTDEAIAGS